MILKHLLDINSRSAGKGITFHIISTVIAFIPAMNNYKWWEKADHLKQKGLYVDYPNRLICPSNLNKKDYENAMAKTKDIPVDIHRFMNQIKEMNQRELDDFLLVFEESNLPILITQSIK